VSFTGTVHSIHLADGPAAPMRAVESAVALEGKGLDGDRYALGRGTFSAKAGPFRQVTLVEIEALRALERDDGIVLAPGDARRNVVTEGVPLNHLVGVEFTVGSVSLRGVKLCQPCGHLQQHLALDGLAGKLLNRGGLNAEVVTGGEIRVGDRVSAP
jgi:MOSC domain-containing protein YiiM